MIKLKDLTFTLAPFIVANPKTDPEPTPGSGEKVKLKAFAMTIPNSMGVYCPSPFTKDKTISAEEFSQYVARPIQVCLKKNARYEDLKNSETMTLYAKGMDCWWRVV